MDSLAIKINRESPPKWLVEMNHHLYDVQKCLEIVNAPACSARVSAHQAAPNWWFGLEVWRGMTYSSEVRSDFPVCDLFGTDMGPKPGTHKLSHVRTEARLMFKCQLACKSDDPLANLEQSRFVLSVMYRGKYWKPSRLVRLALAQRRHEVRCSSFQADSRQLM